MKTINLDKIESLSKEELKKFAHFMLWQYRLVDAFWFLFVEKDFGLDAAVKLNEDVWQKMAKLSAKDIRKVFDIREKGLEGFVKALEYFPWTQIADYQIENRPDEVIITVSKCPPQEGRKKHGLDEFPCKVMHQKEFTEFAHHIDPMIRVTCEFAPPDEHPEEIYCKWRFTMEE